MANLNGQTIRGTNNYKGLLNLDSTIGTPLDATLRAVTDGAGTASLLQLSTEAVGLSRTVNLSAGATTPRLFNVVYTINNSGVQTGTLTGIFLNANEALLNGITHNLMDLQVGGVSKFSVSRTGVTSIGSTAVITGNVQVSGSLIMGSGTTMATPLNGIFTLTNYAGTDFSRLQLGGTTSSFPAIKRNGAAIDFRLADDSAYCAITASTINASGLTSDLASFQTSAVNGASAIYVGSYGSQTRVVLGATYAGFGYVGTTNNYPFTFRTNSIERLRIDNIGSVGIGATSINASAVFQIDSTTQGFLMPRMTQAQILLIATPATGLQVFNTDLAQPCFYDGAGWRRISHSVM